MTHEDFSKFVETFGANIARWPEDIQLSARAFIEANPHIAESMLGEAAAFDAALEDARLSPGTDMLKARILKAAQAQSVEQAPAAEAPSNRKGFGYRAVAAMVLASFALGFAGANLTAPVTEEISEAEYLAANSEWQTLAEEIGISEIYEWVDKSPAS